MSDNKIEKLAEIIKSNPGCVAMIDNDCWTLYRTGCDPCGDNLEAMELADSNTHGTCGWGYGSGSNYGGDILQALALIVGIKVESV